MIQEINLKNSLISIKPETNEKCQLWAKECIETSKDIYLGRDNRNYDKVILDITYGKIAELAAYKHLKLNNINCSKPDFKILNKSQKSFDADLSDDLGNKYQIKSRSSYLANKYSLSWLIDKKDLYKLDDIFIGCLLNTKYHLVESVEIKVFEKINNVIDLFQEPELDNLKLTKKVIYYDDIISKLNDNK